MNPEPDPRGITGGIEGSDGVPPTADGAAGERSDRGTARPPSLSRVDRIASAWAALAAYETRTGRRPGAEMFRALGARGVSVEEVEGACLLLDLEQDITVAGLRGRVEDLDAEVEVAHRAQHTSEVAAFGEAAVTFAHAAHPDAATVMEARDAMTPTDWLIFDRMTDPTHPKETTP